jgi:hypothetical protein
MSAALVVYTCITRGYDKLRPVRSPEPGVRYVCFNDGDVAPSEGWEMLPLPARIANPAAANRYAKMHPHLLFPEHELSVYVDGNIEFGAGVRALAEEALRNHDIAVYSHPFRDCLYAESMECAAIGHDWMWNFGRQMRRYLAAGVPLKRGLFECNILFRRHNDPAVVAQMEAWWDEYLRGAKRDQLSFPYVTWRFPARFNPLGLSGIRSGQGVFRLHQAHSATPRLRQYRGYANLLMPTFWLAARRIGWKWR